MRNSKDNDVDFYILASGSKGNCAYIGVDNTKILIDAGLNCKETEKKLNEIGTSLKEIDGIFITHEHLDHIKGLGVISRKYKIPIYTLEETINEILNKKSLGKINKQLTNCIYCGEDFLLNDIRIEPFDLPHDAKRCIGYVIRVNGIKISIATDFGHITEELIKKVRDSNILVIESNYDEYMLRVGKYPRALKERINSDFGHLDNVETGNLIVKIYNKDLDYVFLSHISDENNLPSKAEETVLGILDKHNIEYNKENKLIIDVGSAMSKKLIYTKKRAIS